MKRVTLILLTALGSLALASGCEQKSRCEKEGATVEISGNHGHEAAIGGDLVARKLGGTYSVSGGTHKHAFMLKDAQMQELAGGKDVTTRATSVNAHTHEVTVKCPK